jgi:hypothetical protein
MLGKTRDQMRNRRWDNPRCFGDRADLSNPQATRLGKIKRTGEHFSWYGSDGLTGKIKPPSSQQYNPGDFLAIGQLNWNDVIDEDNDDENWADHGWPSGGRSHPGDGNDNDDSTGEEDMEGSGKGTGKGMGTNEEKGKGRGEPTEEGKGKGKGQGKDCVKQTPGGDDISWAVALQLHKEMYEADSDTEG